MSEPDSPTNSTSSESTSSSESASSSPSSDGRGKKNKKRKKSYSLKQKRQFVEMVEDLRRQDPSLSVLSICASNGVPHNYYKLWKGHVEKSKTLTLTGEYRGHVTQDTRKLSNGRIGILEDHVEYLSKFITEMRAEGLPVSIFRVTLEANKLSATFRQKSPEAKNSIIHRVVARMGFSHRSPTHVAQKHHKETEMSSKYFMTMVVERIDGIDPDDIFNMDELKPKCIKLIEIRQLKLIL